MSGVTSPGSTGSQTSGGCGISVPASADSGWLYPAILDCTLVPVGIFLLVGYHVYLYMKYTRNPLSTVVGLSHVNRHAWCQFVMSGKGNELLGVQTLRNSMMAAQIMATTSIALGTGVAALVSSTGSLSSHVPGVVLGAHNSTAIVVKFFCLLLCFLTSFLCFIQSIRYNNHVSFLVALPKVVRLKLRASGPDVHSPDYVATVLQRGDDMYTIGIRVLYLAFPLLVWLFGPIPMLVCCVVMVPTLHFLDSAKFDSKKMQQRAGEVAGLEEELERWNEENNKILRKEVEQLDI